MSRALGHLRSTQTHFLRLYAAILRCHRILPNMEMKKMGNEFVRGEFEQHYPTDTLSDEQIRQFFVEWTKYLNTMVRQAKAQMELRSKAGSGNASATQAFGVDLDISTIQEMSPEQIEKIAEFGQSMNILNKDLQQDAESNDESKQ